LLLVAKPKTKLKAAGKMPALQKQKRNQKAGWKAAATFNILPP
jgi:hypothetical protein